MVARWEVLGKFLPEPVCIVTCPRAEWFEPAGLWESISLKGDLESFVHGGSRFSIWGTLWSNQNCFWHLRMGFSKAATGAEMRMKDMLFEDSCFLWPYEVSVPEAEF